MADSNSHKTATSNGITRNKQENVFLFVPNLIGYVRVVLAVFSLFVMPTRPIACVALYCISCLLDAVDGNAARYFNQCSRFGAVLDMVTDRCTTICMLCHLASAFPSFAVHYMHMYSSLVAGAASHKMISKSRSAIYNVLFLFCAGNELFFVAAYLLSFTMPTSTVSLPTWLPVTSLQWLAYAALPICAGKQIISVIQMVGASRALAEKDLEERAEKQL
ncbi:CDP-diacylglycerol--inositol 3-phosphatidyltransferase-like protein [Syncephalis plumigaleata]|nr:CDP-diacylglycerol--inositol 3-phosphatidyltransferase-like protein [Syncephalis plumigaleata]